MNRSEPKKDPELSREQLVRTLGSCCSEASDCDRCPLTGYRNCQERLMRMAARQLIADMDDIGAQLVVSGGKWYRARPLYCPQCGTTLTVRQRQHIHGKISGEWPGVD